MNSTRQAVTWVCIFSTLFVGCYSSALIDPNGEEKDKVYTEDIKMVITKDGTKYEFDKPATLVSNAIVGTVKIQVSEGFTKKEVSIPLSDVQRVEVSQFNPTNTVLLVIAMAVIVGVIYAAAFYNTATNAIEPNK